MRHKQFTHEQDQYIINRCNELMDIGVAYTELCTYFEFVNHDYIEKLGIKSKRYTVLNPFELRFCQEYVKNKFQAQKALEIIRSDPLFKDDDNIYCNSTDILSREKVIKKIKQILESSGVDKEYVISMVRETIEKCSQARPVIDKKGKPVLIDNGEGEIVPAYTFDASNVLKGAELLGKNLALWSDKMELTGKNGGAIETSSRPQLTKDEWLIAHGINASKENS